MKAEPALTVRCASIRGGKPHRLVIAEVYEAADGLRCRTTMMPFIEGTVATLATALNHAAEGRDWLAKVLEERAGQPKDLDVSLQDPPEGGFAVPAVILGCPEHGNVNVSVRYLTEEAESTRRTLNIDIREVAAEEAEARAVYDRWRSGEITEAEFEEQFGATRLAKRLLD